MIHNNNVKGAAENACVIEIPSNTITASKGSKSATASTGGKGGKNSNSPIVRMLSKSSGNSSKGSANSSKGSANSSKGSKGARFESAANGTPCDDGDATTTYDVCFGGVCAGLCAGVTCKGDPHCQVGVCDSTTGACVFTNVDDDTLCNDNDAATDPDVCFGGVCAGRCGGVTCTPNEPCQTGAVCDSLNGGCVFTNAPNAGTYV